MKREVIYCTKNKLTKPFTRKHKMRVEKITPWTLWPAYIELTKAINEFNYYYAMALNNK